MKDGLYVEFFAAKNNIKYPMSSMSLNELTTILTNSFLDGIEKATQKGMEED